MSITKDSTFAATAGKKYKVAFGMRSECLAPTNVFLAFSFLSLYFEYDFHNK